MTQPTHPPYHLQSLQPPPSHLQFPPFPPSILSYNSLFLQSSLLLPMTPTIFSSPPPLHPIENSSTPPKPFFLVLYPFSLTNFFPFPSLKFEHPHASLPNTSFKHPLEILHVLGYQHKQL